MMGPLVLCATLVLFQLGQVFGQARQPPIITDFSALDNRQLFENFPVGDEVGTISANDPDGTQVEFYIRDQGSEFFAIGRTSGVVTLKKALDFDTLQKKAIPMIIRVIDENLQSSEKDGKVLVLDVNDLHPEFEKYDIFDTLDENIKVGYKVAEIRVNDGEVTNDQLSVTCLGQNQEFADACDHFGLFIRDADKSNIFWHGELRVTKALDYENRFSYRVLLNAFDGLYNTTNEVHLEVNDINDSPPIWTRIKPVPVPEEQSPADFITQVSATDGDSTNKRRIHYELVNYNNEFSINNVSGVITNVGRIDFDDDNHNKNVPYEVIVRAREVISADPLELGGDQFTTATAVVSITIFDIDDNTPTFDKKEYTAFIKENIATNANIPGLQMTITDRDSGQLNSFQLVSLDFTDVFDIVPTTGQANAGATLFVKDSEKIDYEMGPKQYIINVEARENDVPSGVTPLTGSATVTINVQDVNDESPQFFDSSNNPVETFTRELLETAPPGDVIIDLNAQDPEEGDFGTAGIRYRLFGNLESHFSIDEREGIILVAPCTLPHVPGGTPCIDYEVKNRYVLTVSATDDLGSVERGRTRSVQVIINILDVNDNVPEPEDTYLAYIIEGNTDFVQPLVIEAVDPDTVGGPVRYALDGEPAVTRNWQIGETSGVITARIPILFSMAQNKVDGSLEFQVTSSDQKDTVFSNVKIIIIDINNNRPEFSVPNYEKSIPEDTVGEIFIYTVTATDGDDASTGNGILAFEIESGARGKFIVKDKRHDQVKDEFYADIYTTPDATFNYDNQKLYEMKLKVLDAGTPNSLSGEATLIVNILDTNNNEPKIVPTSKSIKVAENTPINTNVHRVNAQDPDATRDLRYYMTAITAQNPSQGEVRKSDFDFTQLFRIEEKTGIVRVNMTLNRDQVSLMYNELRVVDIGATPAQTGTGALFITITEVNDQDPEFDLPLYDITIDEELNINYFVRDLHCRDADDNIASYTIVQTEPRLQNFFSMAESTGALIVSDRIDFEKLEQIMLVATCADDGSPRRSGTTDIVINIRNINDNVPQFSESLYTAVIDESKPGEDIGGTFLVKVFARDIDKGDYGIVRYRMFDPDEKFFQIDEMTGEITVKSGVTFDRELKGSYGFQVVAYDSPNTPSKRKETSVPVYLTIEDINDNCPVFSKSFFVGSIPESANLGTDIIDIIAIDKDSGINKEIAYGINDTNGFFSIGPKSGRAFSIRLLTGKAGTYTFNVTATDMLGKSPGSHCTTSVSVQVTISESQNYAPEWIRPPRRDYVIYILESQYEGMLVYNSRAEDRDEGLRGVIDYYFQAGKDRVAATDEFRINQVSGVIRAEVEFDREQVDRYFLTLVAQDKGPTRTTSETTLIVVIMDVDDNDPVFPLKNGRVVPYVIEEMEESRDTQFPKRVGKCDATDADSNAENNRIYYEILSSDERVNRMISVNRDTCEIFLNMPLDYEQTTKIEFNIYAFNERNDDSVSRNKRDINPSILPVVLTVIDINDNPPQFTEDEYFACAALESPFLTSLVDLDAHDVEQEDTQLLYSLADNADDSFEIDRQGIVHNTLSFPSTDRRIFAFDAKVSDGQSSAAARVNVFVTSADNQVKLVVDRPASDVRRVMKNYAALLRASDPSISYACVDVKNHVAEGGKISTSESDVYLAAIQRNTLTGVYTSWSASRLHDHVSQYRSVQSTEYEDLSITEVNRVEDDGFDLDEDVVLAILIIVALMVAAAILLLCLACYCIRDKKKKKVRKIKAQRHTFVRDTTDTKAESFSNPVYHNSGYVAYEDEYSTVSRTKKDVGPIAPVVIPAPENLQPLSSFAPTNLEPAEPTKDPEPVIETSVLSPEESEQPPIPPKLMDPEYEDLIETEVVDDEPLPDPPVDENEIETEIRDDLSVPTPNSPDDEE